MTFTIQIGSGRALFALPGNRFDQVTSEPLRPSSALAPITKKAETK
jgi:hypothetical protein